MATQTPTQSLEGHPQRRAVPDSRCRKLLERAAVARHKGDLLRAEEYYLQAVDHDPRSLPAWAELGCFLADSRRFPEAVSCFRKALLLLPEAPATQDSARELQDPTREVLRLLRSIAVAHPGWAQGHFSLGCGYELIGEFGPARTHLARSVALDGSLAPPVRSLLARIHWREGESMAAIAEADRALQADPSNLLAHAIRNLCWSVLGRMDEAVAGYRRALELVPEPTFHRTMLFGMNFLPDTTAETAYAAACRWNELYAVPLVRHSQVYRNTRDPDRRLRIGYVSPDLCNHAIMRFLPPVFENHDRSQFEMTVYSVGPVTDVMTAQMRATVPSFVAFSGSGAELAKRVQADEIDILLDLAGHTMEWPVYQVFVLKPAPIQVSWLGVLSTTGLSTMDYFLGDALMPCPGTEHLFSERVYRIPGSFCCYRPIADVPVPAAPCMARGYITFGSFHRHAKVTREVVRVWSAVLHAVPGSRLLMKNKGLETEAVQRRFVDWFAEEGIGKGRLVFAAASPPLEYLKSYGEIDIALDPFPYNGGSTSLDALWMGVPFVTMSGRLAVQRAGTDILTLIGSPDLAADTPDQYVRGAAFLADVVPRIPDLRRNVRRALQSSPLMDEAGVVRRVEDAFRDMWRTWCRQPVKLHDS